MEDVSANAINDMTYKQNSTSCTRHAHLMIGTKISGTCFGGHFQSASHRFLAIRMTLTFRLSMTIRQ